MMDLFKNALYLGVGLAFMTKDKIEETGKTLAREAGAGAAEGKKFIDDLVRKSDEAREAMEKRVNEAIDKSLARLNLPTRREFEALEKRVRALEEKSIRVRPEE